MSVRFNLNVSLVLKERPFLERFDWAARLGFGAVEMWWPHDVEHAALVRKVRDAGLRVVTMNFYGGDLAAGERGILNDPIRQQAFRDHVPVALELADALGASFLTVLAGKWREGEDRGEQLRRVADGVAFAADRAAAAGKRVLVEALNSHDNGPFMLTGSRETVDLIRRVGKANVSYQLDLFHMQRMGEDLFDTVRRHTAAVGHIQIADCPGRHEPGSGEIPFRALFQALVDAGYGGSIGLEYVPRGAVEDSLAWLPVEARGRDVDIEELHLPR